MEARVEEVEQVKALTVADDSVEPPAAMKQSTETRGGSDVSASKVADESMDPGAAMKQFIGNRRSEAQNVKVNIADLNLPPEAKEAFDVDGDGQVDIAEIIAYVNKHKALKKTYNFVTKAFFLTVVMMILFLVLCLASTVLAIQITKEVTVSNGALTATSATCVNGSETCTKPVATGPTKRESHTLTSTMPESVFEELKSISLKLPHQNGKLVSVTLDVSSFERRFVPTSRCGSVVDLETIHGTIMLDDNQLLVTEEFVEKMNERGYDLQDDVPISVDGGRRLSVGSDIAGMFNFIAEYEYKCESQVKPLRMLDPPFAFTLETYQMCEGSTCYSDVETLSGNGSNGSLKLPGFARDPHALETFVPGGFIKAKESVYAMASDKILTIQEWPNYPMMSLISMHDFAMGMFTQKQVFNETPTYCSSRESKDEENTVANMADFVIAAIGTTSYKSDPDLKFNRYLLYHKEHPNKVEAYVEFWEEVDTGMPHKYFLPNMENSPRAYFTSFRNISQDEFDAVEARLSRLDCHGPQIYGLVTPIMDADDTTPAHENMSTLEFYRALNSICLNEACQVSFGDDDYWNVILSLDALFRNRTKDVESDAPDGANATRRLASSIGVCLTDCKSLLANGWSYQRSSSKDKDFFGIVKFAYDTGTWTKGSSNPPMAYSSFKGSAQAGFSYNVPPVYISVRAHGAAQGEVTVRGSDGKVFSKYSGSVTLSFEGGLNIIIGQVTLGISGTISFEQASNPTSTPAMDVAGTIRGGITIKVLGGFVTASASVGLQARFWNLGPTFEGNDANDDEFAVAGKVRFKATIFWFFKMSFSAKMDIVKRRKLWSQTDLMGGYDPASIGLNCVEISKHDRDCSGTVQFRKFCPMNEEYSYDDPVNMQNCPYHYNTYDKSKGSMIFRHTNAAFFKSGVLSRDDAPEDVTWLCSSTGKSRDWGFRRRDGRRRWAKFAMANRFVIFGDEKNLGMVAYNCQY